jgi:Na+-driven multidrug efflux pump
LRSCAYWDCSLTAIIQSYGRFTSITAAAALNLVVIWALMSVCLPRFGVVGAAVALLIGETVNALIQVVILVRVSRGSKLESNGGND